MSTYYNLSIKTATYGSVKVQGLSDERKFNGSLLPVEAYAKAIEGGNTASIKDGRKTVEMPRVTVLDLVVGDKLQEVLAASSAVATTVNPLLEQLLAQVAAPAPRAKQQSQSDWDSASCLFLVKVGLLTSGKDDSGKTVYDHCPIWGWVMMSEVWFTKKAVAALLDGKQAELLAQLQEAAANGRYVVTTASKGSKHIMHYNGVLRDSQVVLQDAVAV